MKTSKKELYENIDFIFNDFDGNEFVFRDISLINKVEVLIGYADAIVTDHQDTMPSEEEYQVGTHELARIEGLDYMVNLIMSDVKKLRKYYSKFPCHKNFKGEYSCLN